MIFKLDFIEQIHLLYYPQIPVFSFHTLLFSYISSSKERNIETLLALPYSYNWQNNKTNEKRSQEYQSMDPEYVTEQINNRILEFI